jgi:hypothetical protein
MNTRNLFISAIAVLMLWTFPADVLAQKPKLPPLPGTGSSSQGGGNNQGSNIRPSDSTEGVTEAQVNQEYLLGMAASMHNLVVGSIRDALCVIKQDYYVEDQNGNKMTSQGKDYFGRQYGIAIAANGRLWTMNKVMSPWIEDNGFKNLTGSHTPIRATSGIRRLDTDRSVRNIAMTAHVEENLYLGYYDFPEPIRYASIASTNRKTEGRLVMFFVHNGEDPETAEIQSQVFNIAPDWSKKGLIRNPIPDYNDKIFLGGVYVIEEEIKSDATKAQASGQGRGKSTRGKSGNQSGQSALPDEVGIIQFRVVGFYEKSGNDKLIHALPGELTIQESNSESKGRNSGGSRRSGGRSRR